MQYSIYYCNYNINSVDIQSSLTPAIEIRKRIDTIRQKGAKHLKGAR
jgi:hypothetical protein